MIRRLTYTSPRSHVLASTSHMRKALSVPEQVRLLRYADKPYKYKGRTVVHGRHCTGGWLCACLTFWLGLVQVLYSNNPHTRTCGLRTPRLKFGKKGAYI